MDALHKMMSVAPRTCGTLRKALAEWYAVNHRDLPWRRTGDPYQIWLSEVMLQQTQVRTVEPYFRRFIILYPDVDRLARADLQAVLKIWEGLGYYSRARNLHKAAGIVVSRMSGQIPDTWEALRGLPGVGDYIAAAVLSIAFGQAYAVVDGNVKRVLARLFRPPRLENRVSDCRSECASDSAELTAIDPYGSFRGLWFGGYPMRLRRFARSLQRCSRRR